MGIVLFVISTICLLLITVTMLCRANDLRFKRGVAWNARLLGFMLAGTAPLGIIGEEVFTRQWPDVYTVAFRVGLLLVFLTSPHLPPWWRWVGKGEHTQ